ncbi:DUF2147 domain-containing protein [Cecembia calidifontis]|jgi:uncharacterized protein (DUF2147 family)|uniref:Uncharacterized protein DUF2147 n=1 Tax=Cecembia calidifontis TaxID=1187080 RepID=A0A4Q7PCN0_9BACT|nr:DUF2147 domain-containing protein [Cecembia calidifontis]RZS98084.1 uncharacterized protein DUF2147 [Cecembia calidifontis]
MIKKTVLILALLIFNVLEVSMAQKATSIIGKWYNTEKDAIIEIFEERGKFFGRVVWLKEPLENGRPVLDSNNADRTKRNNPIIGLKLLENFEFKAGIWENGTIYDPRNGKTYSSTIRQKSERVLEVRGFIGLSLIGRTVEWTRAE